MNINLLFQELLTKHKILSADFLEANYDRVFTPYQHLLNSENYVTRRQALKVHLTVYFLGTHEIRFLEANYDILYHPHLSNTSTQKTM